LTGTANVLSMKAFEAAISVFEEVQMDDLRIKSSSLTSFMIDLYDQFLAPKGFTLGSPRDPQIRGSHVALGFAAGKELVDTMSARGIVADFRPPDLLRFGCAPLYNSHQDVVTLVQHLAAV